jgi:phosphohistidine swiveling domain-containing protein
LQDKVEFEILFTCYDFNFEERAKELLRGDFNEKEVLEIKRSLIKLTNNLIINYQKEIDNDFKSIFSLEENRIDIDQINILEISSQKLIDKSKVLLDDCKEKGTIQFSKLARLGFIAKIMLKSLVENKVITQDEFDLVYNSINTVATDISKDFEKLSFNLITKKQFIKKYYHLRPGTYDITSLRYNSNHDLIKTNIQRKKEENINRNQEVKNYSPDKETIDSINMAFEKKGFTFTAEHFLNFVKSATEARELSKFEFTKNLSDALELIALSGELMGFTRKELAQLDIKDIFKINIFGKDEKIEIWKDFIKKREKINQENDLLILPSIITSEKDFEIIEHYQAKPNFITQKIVESRVININENKQEIDGVEGNIVLIENGDPGYDWIFTRNPSGLITKYGGIASHMSIRCAEFGIPAAIGCGEDIFNMIKKTEKVRIDCRENKITPLS